MVLRVGGGGNVGGDVGGGSVGGPLIPSWAVGCNTETMLTLRLHNEGVTLRVWKDEGSVPAGVYDLSSSLYGGYWFHQTTAGNKTHRDLPLW